MAKGGVFLEKTWPLSSAKEWNNGGLTGFFFKFYGESL
jgi:hypothetical protein